MAEAHPTDDEYNWETYTQEYSAQVDQMEAAPHQGSDFLVRRWGRSPDGELELLDNLHSNWAGIYKMIDQLKPSSTFECGCGGMYHLKNIKTLFPDIDVSACDLLQTQIDFGAKKFNVGQDILANVTVRDFSKEDAAEDLGTYDFVYSHAVIMHISSEKALSFLKNMLTISNKYVFLVEGEQHDYERLLRDIGESDNWEVIHPMYPRFCLLTKKGVEGMIESDMKLAEREKLIKNNMP